MSKPVSLVRYQARVNPARHELLVSAVLDGAAAARPIRLQVPTWVPGDYEFSPYGRDVFDVAAFDQVTGAPLPVRRLGWQAYEVAAGDGAVEVRYRAACSSSDLSEACGILDDRYGVILGARYLFNPGYPGPCSVEYTLPEGWDILHPSGARRVGATTWEYPSYEVLLDTPVVMGGFDLVTREVRGVPFEHVFLTRGVGYDSQVEGFVDQLVKVAEAYHDLFGSFPFDRYTYVFSLDPTADWGLEHLTSTMIGLGPEVFTDPDQYAIGIRTCAHEIFHAWNVRRLRPAPLDRLDLMDGSFTEGLWVAEGFTRYYEFLTTTRTGIYSPDQFFSSVVNYFRHLAVLPAYRRVTAVDSSLATYLNHAKYEGRTNSAIDYYDKGMVIAFDLDAALRACEGGQTLDSAFSAFYRAFVGRGLGYTTADIRDYFEAIQPGLGAQIEREATRTGELSLVEQLERLGFTVTEENVPCLGIVLQDDEGPTIYSVLDTSSAGESGLASGDVIVAVDGYPFRLGPLKWAITHQREVTLEVRRGDQPRHYTIPVGERGQIGSLRWSGTATQAARIAAWLGQEFAPEQGQDFPLDFYENFHGVETVL